MSTCRHDKSDLMPLQITHVGYVLSTQHACQYVDYTLTASQTESTQYSAYFHYATLKSIDTLPLQATCSMYLGLDFPHCNVTVFFILQIHL